MKLIPVQRVNGQFVQSRISQPRMVTTPQKAVTINISSAPVQLLKKASNPSGTKQIFMKQVSFMNVCPNEVGLDLGHTLNKHPPQRHNVNLMAIVPIATPAANSGKLGRLPSQLPVTVKSPSLPRGQCLQIPPSAKVPTVSEQPLGMKKHIFISPANNSSQSSGSPSVVYMSPITGVNQGVTPQRDSAVETLNLLCKIANTTSCGLQSEGSKPHLISIPKVSQRPNSPIKWVIDEEDGSTAPTLDPINSVTSAILRVVAERENAGKHCDVITKPGPTLDPIHSVTSEILRVAAQREKSSEHCDVITKPVSVSSQGKCGHGQENTLEMCNRKHPLNQQNVHVMAIAPIATPAANSGKLGRLPSQLPVTVKSPSLPRGQCLQIPPNAKVPTVSEQPLGMKKLIFISPANNSSQSSGSPSVVYMSPITGVNQGVTPQRDSAVETLNLLCKIANTTSCGLQSEGSKPHLTLIPKVSQRPNSPIKWVIDEEDGSTAPTLDPINSSVTSAILRVVAERENAGKHCDLITTPVSGSSQGKSGQENTLVMCKGKVFFVAKSCSLSYKMGKGDLPTTARKTYEFNKTIGPSSQQSIEAVAPQKRESLRIITSVESDEVIDLCDDDSSQAASGHMSAVNHLEEDNVIFVSYIPPKSESTPNFRLSQMETEQMGTSSFNIVTEQKSLKGETGALGRRQQLESMEVDVETKRPADPITSDGSSGKCSLLEKDTHELENSMDPGTSWTSLPAPESCEMADHLLRQIFGITADVKISLQRIDGASVGSLPAEPLLSESIRSVDDNQEPTSRFKEQELCLQDFNSPQEVKVQTEQKLSEASASLSTCTYSGPLKCSHFKVNKKPLSALSNKCQSGNTSPKAPSCDYKTEPGYVEPIDEDFISTDENDIPNSQDTAARPQTPTCVDLNINTGRMGRKRKSTMCPCCMPAVKSSAKSKEPEEWAWTTEQASKKGCRTKFVRKDVKASRRINCQTAKNNSKTSEVPASDSLSTKYMDADELKLHAQIKRLKELLQEKEAALELMRNSTS
ncbi:uncharacterized protein lrif1 isoform X2 [Cottoperca gobio]|nr:ligand-dependent nuclear receptor-interacting factor 1 isoform X2 [Cottoperca gobio]